LWKTRRTNSRLATERRRHGESRLPGGVRRSYRYRRYNGLGARGEEPIAAADVPEANYGRGK